MRIFSFGAAIWLLGQCFASAQVAVEVAVAQEQFLPGESIPVVVRISNTSGQMLQLGEEDNWLSFFVESRDGQMVGRNGQVPVKGAFTVESSQRASKHVDIGPYFDLEKQGNYRLTVSVKVPQWQKELSSKPIPFNIIKANTFWEQEVGLPLSGGDTNAHPEVRKYALQKANYLNTLRLYVRITDVSEGRLYKLLPLGPLVSFNTPEAMVDRGSHLHILQQTGAKAFGYAVISPEGDIVCRQTHDYSNTRPHLRKNDTGQVTVVGGARRVSSSDIPEMKFEPYPGDLPVVDRQK